MIKEIKVYTAICDVCGANICEGTGYSGWCKDGLDNELIELAWIEKDGKNYCDRCWYHDDNDNLILREATNENNN